MRIAVTGASGLVGLATCAELVRAGHDVVGLARSDEGATRVAATGARVLPGALEEGSLDALLAGCSAVVHLAQIGKPSAQASFDAVNVDGTRAVVASARRAGVQRIAFLSGLGVAHYGMTRHCTNAYFRSKLRAEAELFASGLELAIFRPSYIVGPASRFVAGLVRGLRAGEVERVGDGRYRMQPIALGDVAALLMAAVLRPMPAQPFVFDLVGPEALDFNSLLERLAVLAGEGAALRFSVREVAVEEAYRRAGTPGQRGSDDLDCLLCDEVGDKAALEALLGRSLTPLDAALRSALGSPAANGVGGIMREPA